MSPDQSGQPSEWARFLTRGNQLFRAKTHPAAVRLPVQGRMPSIDGATGWVNVDDQGNGTVTEPGLYQLIRQPGPITDRTFEDAPRLLTTFQGGRLPLQRHGPNRSHRQGH